MRFHSSFIVNGDEVGILDPRTKIIEYIWFSYLNQRIKDKNVSSPAQNLDKLPC